MGNQQGTSDFDIGWLIGIIDGEGSFWIGYSPSGMLPVFELSNTNKRIIGKAQNILLNLGIPCHVYTPTRNSGQKEYQKLEVKGIKRLAIFFRILSKYFECRFEQADLLRQFVEYRIVRHTRDPYGETEHSIYRVLKEFNKRGC